jgi:hypothetical protein
MIASKNPAAEAPLDHIRRGGGYRPTDYTAGASTLPAPAAGASAACSSARRGALKARA